MQQASTIPHIIQEKWHLQGLTLFSYLCSKALNVVQLKTTLQYTLELPVLEIRQY